MNKTNSIVVLMALILFVVTAPLHAGEQAQTLTLFSFDKGFDVSKVIATDAKINLSQAGTWIHLLPRLISCGLRRSSPNTCAAKTGCSSVEEQLNGMGQTMLITQWTWVRFPSP